MNKGIVIYVFKHSNSEIYAKVCNDNLDDYWFITGTATCVGDVLEKVDEMQKVLGCKVFYQHKVSKFKNTTREVFEKE